MEFFIDTMELRQTGATPVRNRRRHPMLMLNGRLGILNEGFVLTDLLNHELGRVRQRSIGVFPRFELIVDDTSVGTIKQMFGVWHEFIYVSDLNWIVMGNLLTNQYRTYHGIRLIMQADSQTWMPDGIHLTVNAPDDCTSAILLAILLDHFSRIGSPHLVWPQESPLANDFS
ncbi:LURP-one-related/scramblase family protein [Lacticaseibacillus saniviri]